MDRFSQNAAPAQRGRPVSGMDAAHASEYLEHFINATSLKTILGYHRTICDYLHLKPNVFPHFYPKLRANLTSWRAKAIFKKFDARASHKCYGKGKVCANTRVLIIGAGPCGLRTAIEAQLLGAKVVVIEKRDRLSRNNVLHLWPFVIEDLRTLGAKKFFGKFCAGAIDHISIRQLQCVLFKIALLLGVEIHTEVSFEQLLEPSATEKTGWRAEFTPADHPVSQYEFDVIIGADGKRNTLQGFKRKEFRGKLAIAITANFINKKTEAEARVEEISGVAFIFNQKFFKDLYEETKIDLENIVYYKDDTHYFVMTAKKASLIEKGVIKQDLSDTEKLLGHDNVDRDALQEYAKEAANFSTNYQMPDLEFAVNHYGQPDVAMFDFTSMYAAENASKTMERNGHQLLMILVGDSLLEPFWPTGSGCARGFLSSLDAAWAIRSWTSPTTTPLDVLAERESIYRLLAQTTPDNLNKDWKSYTLDPATRYPNLNKNVVLAHQVISLYDTDNPNSIEQMKRSAQEIPQIEVPKKRRRGDVDNEVLINWISDQIKEHEDIAVTDFESIFKDGKVLCAIIHHYRPDLLDYNAIKDDDPVKNNQLAFDVLEKELGIPPIMTGEEITNTEDYLTMASYLTQVYHTFRGEIPHIKHPKLPPNPDPAIPTNAYLKYRAQSKQEKAKQIAACIQRTLSKQAENNSIKESQVVEEIYNSDKKMPPNNTTCNTLLLDDSLNDKCMIKDEVKKRKRKKAKKAAFTYVLYPISESPSVISTKIIHQETILQSVCEINTKEPTKKLSQETLNSLENICSLPCVEFAKLEDAIFEKTIDKALASSQHNQGRDLEDTQECLPEGTHESPPEITEDMKAELDQITESLTEEDNSTVVEVPSELRRDPEVESSQFKTYKVEQTENKSAVNIHIIEKSRNSSYKYQEIHFEPLKNTLTISTKSVDREKIVCCKETAGLECQNRVKKEINKRRPVNHNRKFLSANNMSEIHQDSMLPDQIYSRVSTWISTHDFKVPDDSRRSDIEGNTVITEDITSDITSVTKCMAKKRDMYDDIKIEERTDEVHCGESPAPSVENFTEMMKNMSCNKVVRTLSKFSQYSPFKSTKGNIKSPSPCSKKFSVIVEGEETELPDSSKRSETTFKTVKLSDYQQAASQRASSRHKRHADMMSSNKPTVDRKTRKRRTLERVGASVVERQRVLEEIVANRNDRHNKRRQQRRFQTEQFLKSMQMLQANAKPDNSQPFEDYSIFLYRQNAPNFEERVKDLEKKFTYVPDHENKLPSQTKAGNDEDLQARIKSLENKWNNPQPVDRKPKDLLRAIGKIETSDWNIKEIEKKIMENKLGKPSNKDKEKVPKWSKEQFIARQTKMESKHLDRQDSAEARFADIDKNIKHLDMKLKEGTVRDLGQNKVASITEKLVSKVPAPKEQKPIEKNTSRPPINLPTQAASEYCHFCGKRVYLMERLSAEGRFFHHGCFKCQYCHTQLRLGSYSFDRDGQYGHKFFCIHHYGMQGELPRPTRVSRKQSQRLAQDLARSPEKKRSAGVAGLDLLDRVQTPERIEFANLSTGSVLSDHEEALSQMDEDEWTDKNFGASCAELDDSDESSSYSESDSDDEDDFDDALEEPATKEGTLRWAQRLKYHRNKNKSDSDRYSSSDQSSYDENSSDDDESDTATEGEEEIRARELRKQEVRVEPPVVHTDTGTDTEIVSDETSSESSEIQNSATEISTDSEFAQDDPTPTREVPSITFNDCNVTKTRGSSGAPRRIQVTTGYIQKPVNGKKAPKPDIELKLRPLVPSAPIIKKPAPVLQPPTEGYALNRTQSTGGIAAKKSLELKKKYLLGESAYMGGIQKSGSASTLDTKFRSFQTDISDCQKLLKPAPEISASMKVFCSKLDENFSSKVSPSSSPQLIEKEVEEVVVALPPPDITKDTEKADPYVFQNELEGRPRSPVHETSIIVPEIDWSKKKSNSEDSLSITSSSGNEFVSTPNFQFKTIPKVEVHTAVDEEEIPPDSLCVLDTKAEAPKPVIEPVKSIASEKKTLNQPKSLPHLERMLPEIHHSLHVRYKKDEPEKPVQEVDNKSSGRSTPDSAAEQVTIALTETELSDWAREGEVSDDLEEFAEFELHDNADNNRSSKKPKEIVGDGIKKADIAEPEDFGHVCGKEKDTIEVKNKVLLEEGCKSINANFENIEFMDTGTETSSDDGIVDSQNGYVLFKNDDELPEDSLNPIINEIVEAKNENVVKNTGYCIISSIENNFGSEVIDLKPSDLEKLKLKQTATEHDDDSLLIVDTGTTTEENTCSDSTVKNVADIIPDKPKSFMDNNNFQKKRLEEKLATVKAEHALLKQNGDQSKQSSQQVEDVNLEFDEHCHRLQSKVDFGNAKDSIDVRKSRRKSKSELPQKPDLIQEEKEKPSPVHTPVKDITLNLTPAVRTPDVLYKRENIKKERDVNQKLIQEMVMNKMKAENKSLERKKRNRTPNKHYDLSKSATTDISQINLNNSNRNSTYSNSSVYSTPDVLLSTNSVPLQLSHSINTVPSLNASSEYSTPLGSAGKTLFNDFQTPKAPPRQKHEDLSRNSEKMKQAARERARLMSNEDLGLSPEDKLLKVKEKHSRKGKENANLQLENKNSWLYTKKTPNNIQQTPTRTKSISGINNNFTLHSPSPDVMKMCKSDPNLLDTQDPKQKKKSKGESFAKSFLRKSQSFFKNLSPKKIEKDKSKDVIVETPVRRKSYSELSSEKFDNISPPPIPPLPVNYTGNSIKGTDESSDGEHDWKKHELSSCDTLDQSGILENSITSVSGRRSRSSRKAARQTQLKRHRMAQEIQRKLEETEVKMRELEKRGVLVEKALRGEDSEHCSKEESDLLQEWFDLMRDRTELRRYEKELMVRAQELELEDRHARLQHDLRERLENDQNKTDAEAKAEESIITEMLEIVSKRDSLIAVLEEDRLRYSNEDRDLEEQMLAKGLRLTPIRKSPEK